MLVSEIVTMILGNLGVRSQLTQSQALQLVNQIQTIAFSKDLSAFIISDKFLTVTDGSKGPYPFPSSPPVRKLIGVTTYGQDVVMGISQGEVVDDDYGFNPRIPTPTSIYLPLAVDQISRTFTFLSAPAVSMDKYRVVYYRRPDPIRAVSDDSRLIIPQEYHHTLVVQGAIALSDFGLLGRKTPEQVLEPYLRPFWDYLLGSTDPNNTSYISEQ